MLHSAVDKSYHIDGMMTKVIHLLKLNDVEIK
jgi:hypothetical protein